MAVRAGARAPPGALGRRTPSLAKRGSGRAARAGVAAWKRDGTGRWGPGPDEGTSVMPRVKRGSKRRDKRKKLLSRAKGYFLGKSKLYKFAKEAVDRAGNFAYVGRKRKKRDFRRLWIIRINAAARMHEMTYSQFMAGLKRRRDRARPQVARRDRGHRHRGLRQARRVGEGGPPTPSRLRPAARRGRSAPRAGRPAAPRLPMRRWPTPSSRSVTKARALRAEFDAAARRGAGRRRRSRRCATASSAASRGRSPRC